MADTKRVAMLGAGLAAAPYLSALPAIGTEVVAVATRSYERHRRVSSVFPGAVRCWPPEAVFEHGPLDAVLVLTPPAAHLDSVTLCARHRVPVVLEKPVEVTAARAHRLREVAARAELPVAVMLQYRFRQASRRLHEVISEGRLGRVRAATLDFRWWRPQSYYDEPGRGSYARDGGGVLITQAIHALDLLLWLVGEPVAVAALLGRSMFHEMEAEDVATAILEYEDGAMASIFATTGSRGPDRMVLRVFGETAAAELTENALVVTGTGTDPWEFRDSESYDGSHPMAFSDAWHRDLLTDALTAFQAGERPEVGLDEGIRVIEFLDALERADAAGAWIAMRTTDEQTKRR